jgi:hypothetical protein
MLALVAAPMAAQAHFASADATVNMPVPASIDRMTPAEVVAGVLAQRHELYLSDGQFESLRALERRLQSSRLVSVPQPVMGGKFTQLVTIDTPWKALELSFRVLTPQQQHQSLMLFAKRQPA